ncbi:hypothetical protein HHL23_13355 [Chryseobacterium sp. RP-3-3]|uniref:Uncharacterized protein n=1 Tax=Chryseobacterium antibioticum TaxID=2728847 RepID=A0A7Y0AP05_9FLAO|nr:hypothetical protein [Chryseobacterium antibioticum]NML70774.1 hypothetical protein [Chryseobacterium antibioticum]
MNLCTKPIIRTTGLHCPISGIWESIGSFRTTCPIAKGSKMPDYCGKKVQWKLVQIG